MTKSKNNRSGININATSVSVGGDLVGGDKTVNQSGNNIDFDEAKKLFREITEQLVSIQGVNLDQKNQLIELSREIHSDMKSETPDLGTIANKLENLKGLLNSVKGIGTAGFGVYMLIENLIKFFSQ